MEVEKLPYGKITDLVQYLVGGMYLFLTRAVAPTNSDHWPASPKETFSGSEVTAWCNGKNRASKTEGSDESEGLILFH